MTSLVIGLPALLVLSFADPAPSAATPPAAAGAEPSRDDWSSQYDRARASMLAGRFADAAALFEALAAGARDASQQTRAREQADLCARWVRGGFVLMRASDLRAVEARAVAAAPPPLPDRRSADELGILYTAAVLYGLGSGVALDVWIKPGSAASGIPPVLALGGAAAGVVYLLDRPQDLRYGVAQSITSGMWIGFEEGLSWMLWNQARAVSSEEWSGTTVATALWGTATAGAILGGTLGTAYGTTPGRASFMGSAALWTSLVAGLLGGAAVQNSPTSDDTFMLASAVGLNGGVVAGVLIGKEVSPSIARVRFLDLGALAGGILVGGIYLAISSQHTSGRALAGAVAGGVVGGFATAWQLTSAMEPDYPRAGRPAPEPTSISTLTPTLAPSASSGRGVDGLALGLGGVF